MCLNLGLASMSNSFNKTELDIINQQIELVNKLYQDSILNGSSNGVLYNYINELNVLYIQKEKLIEKMKI